MPKQKLKAKAARNPRPRKHSPRHQLTLEEAVTRVAVHGVSSKAMFGGRCYYIYEKPFSWVLGNALALRLPEEQLNKASERGDGQVFHPGAGDTVMREYLELSDQALADEETIDTYVRASTRFMGGHAQPEHGLVWDDLRTGRDALYKRKRTAS